MPAAPVNWLQLVLTVIVCPTGGMWASVSRSVCVLIFRASRGPAVTPSTQPKTSTASASVATAPMPVRRLVFISALCRFMFTPPRPRVVRLRDLAASS